MQVSLRQKLVSRPGGDGFFGPYHNYTILIEKTIQADYNDYESKDL